MVGRFTCFHVSASFGIVFGLSLSDGSRVAVKGTPAEVTAERLRETHAVQRSLADSGFPAPRPMQGPLRIGPGFVVVDEWLDRGDFRPTRAPVLRSTMAATYARLIQAATAVAQAEAFPPALVGRWETPHHPRFDFGRDDGRWIDEAAEAVRPRVFAPADDLVVGHADWNAQHVRWVGNSISAIYDWDLVRDSEANLVGYASAVFTATWRLPVPKAPSREDSTAFVRDYESAVGRRLDPTRVAAARSYLLAYVARCELSDLDGADGDFQRALREQTTT